MVLGRRAAALRMSRSSWWEVRLESSRLLPVLGIHLGPAPSGPPGPRAVASFLLPWLLATPSWSVLPAAAKRGRLRAPEPVPPFLYSALQDSRAWQVRTLVLRAGAARKTPAAPPRPALPARLSSSLSSSLPQARHRPASGHWHGLLPPLGTPRSRCPHGRGLLVSHVSARRHCLRDALLTVPAGAAPSQPRSCPHRAQLCPSGGSVLETILLFTRLFSVSLQLPAAPGRWGMASLLSSAGSPVPRTGPGTQ